VIGRAFGAAMSTGECVASIIFDTVWSVADPQGWLFRAAVRRRRWLRLLAADMFKP